METRLTIQMSAQAVGSGVAVGTVGVHRQVPTHVRLQAQIHGCTATRKQKQSVLRSAFKMELTLGAGVVVGERLRFRFFQCIGDKLDRVVHTKHLPESITCDEDECIICPVQQHFFCDGTVSYFTGTVPCTVHRCIFPAHIYIAQIYIARGFTQTLLETKGVGTVLQMRLSPF